MEPPRSLGRKIQRKPLADCTNTVSRPNTVSSSSSAVKFANPSLTSSLKRLVHQTTLKEKPKHVVDNSESSIGIATKSKPETRRISADLGFPAASPSRTRKLVGVDKSKLGGGSASRSVATSVRPVTRRMSTDLGFPATVPSRPLNSISEQGVGDKDIGAPYSVYTVRRKASGMKRNKDAASSGAVANLRLDLISSSGKKTRQAKETNPKPLKKVAPRKRQRTVKHEEDNVTHGASQDYIEQQRAYFAEIDAFELPEEEVSSSDLD
ncbi:hypothetical protein AALP_AA5G203400 [Arabis alpina]|uniref:Sororin C-terminal region domain-containing protein n=1 Tax=Arabis alpina TaxID=50452 RepID=A0A087GYB3_ARAAL|nr:hypothetical protein AALP_AA5G203400 [Arabis alpina]